MQHTLFNARLIVLSLSAATHKQKQHFFLAPWILSFLFHNRTQTLTAFLQGQTKVKRTGQCCDECAAAKGSCLYEGAVRYHGDMWNGTGCEFCNCNRGQVLCQRAECARVECPQVSVIEKRSSLEQIWAHYRKLYSFIFLSQTFPLGVYMSSKGWKMFDKMLLSRATELRN